MGRPGRPRKNSPRAGGPSRTSATKATQQEQPKQPNTSTSQQWTEPPLANLRPSYQENDPNSERNVSTAYMQPLGKLPTKQVAKTGTGRRPGRPSLGKGKQTSSAQSSRTQTPKPTPPVPLPRTGTFFLSINSEDEGDNSTRTAQGRQRLSMVVEAAVQRSTEVGNVELGRAIRKLHDDSLNNPDLAHLLDVVLAQKASLAQTQHFQHYIRQARESLAKAESQMANGNGKPAEGLVAQAAALVEAPVPKKRGRKKKTVLSASRIGSEDSMLSVDANGHSVKPPMLDDGDETVSESETTDKKVKAIQKPQLPPDSELIKYSAIRHSPRPVPGPNEIQAKRRGKKRARSTSPGREMEYSSEPYIQDDGSEFGGPPQKRRNTRVKTTSETHVMAGVSQATQAFDPRDNNDPSENISDNDDFCSACGGMGTVICCDRCPLSFHYTCVNPPLEGADDESWFCNKCENMIRPKPRHPRGLFSDLLDNVDRKNPTAFSLPTKLKNYFEGVQAGKHGEYVDLADAKTGKSKNQESEYYKLQTKDGEPILCHKCGLSSLGKRIVLKCDYCPLNWHLDCLDPPPANPPPASRKWECPAHIERHFTIRRPRNAKVIDTYLRRGHKNNGIIEIANESDGEEESFREEYHQGYVYRLPEKGIKLDFIAAVRRKQEEDRRTKMSESTRVTSRASSIPSTAPGSVPPEQHWTLADIEAAEAIAKLNLTSPETSQQQSGITKVFSKLITEAEPEDHKKLQDFETQTAADSEAEQMRLIIALAQKRLQNLEQQSEVTKSSQGDVDMLSKEVTVDMPSPSATRIIPEIVASPGPGTGV